jgi:glycosyltransferase involved in cell wall biosynthesis
MMQQLVELRRCTDAIAARQDQLFAAQAELTTRLRRTQALTARAYEALQDWPALLQAARTDPGYEVAYQDPDPLISIPIPTFKSPDTLCERALASVRSQTHRNWEAIVVGDHCTDETEQRVLALGDPRIRFHNLAARENDPPDPWERWAVKGSVPRSVGVSMALGRWIAPLSHDDEWDSDHLEALLAVARESRCEVAYSRMRVVDALAAGQPVFTSIGAWPPRLGGYAWQSSMFHSGLRFLRYDRACAFASEPNDWNLARRAWEAGVRFQFVDRETATLFHYSRERAIEDEYAAAGLPPSAAAYP